MLRTPEFITFTGADNWTDVNGMRALSRKYPIEWGVLFSRSRQGTDPRYPSVSKISNFMWSDLRLSAHLCGAYTEEIMAEGRITGHVPADLGYFHRIQINHRSPAPEQIIRFRSGWGKMRCIAQTPGDTDDFPPDTSVDWLCDASGGRGQSRTSWPKKPMHRLVGFAGGLNPANVVEALHVISAGDGQYWIDMESGVRTDDRFDLEKCRAVCEAVYGGA